MGVDALGSLLSHVARRILFVVVEEGPAGVLYPGRLEDVACSVLDRGDEVRLPVRHGRFRRRLRLWAKDIRIPTEHLLLASSAAKERARGTVPALLPREFVAPTLSDFTPWQSIPQAQRAAGLAALMIITGDDMKTAGEHQGNDGRNQMPLRRTWWNLESRGLLADYFDVVGAAAQRLLATTDLPAVASRSSRQRVS